MKDELQPTNGTPVGTQTWHSALSPIRHSQFSICHAPAWGQHFVHHLATQGTADFALANGSMLSNQSGENDTWLPS